MAGGAQHFFEEIGIAREAEIFKRGVDEPEAGIDRVIRRLIGVVVEEIGDHSLADVLGEDGKGLLGFVESAGVEEQAGQGD